MGWLIALVVLTGIAILPIGVSAAYSAGGARIQALVGPVRLKVYPREKKVSDKKKSTDKKNQPTPKKESSGSVKDFMPLLQSLLDFLGEAKGKLRVRRLDLKLTLGGDDPSDLALNYGKTWAAVGNLLPMLERHFVIKKRNVEVLCDFTSNETRIYAHLDITITVGRLLTLGVRHGIPVLREYFNILKLRKGGGKV